MCLQLLFLIDLEIIMELKFRHFCLHTKEMLYSDRHYFGLEDFFSQHPSETSDDMQFTGLKDKNGKGLYEDDIYVKWGKTLKCDFEQTIYDKMECTIFDGDFEIIGNIYENPELIKPL